uniref:Uncharacterized protein n=1 Tax=Nephila pilipes TaxID=299642 RepID=A0A8X6NMR6_NEPPI|nr:hypothetical protein NPIL_455821 [Nephila pilipes]
MTRYSTDVKTVAIWRHPAAFKNSNKMFCFPITLKQRWAHHANRSFSHGIDAGLVTVETFKLRRRDAGREGFSERIENAPNGMTREAMDLVPEEHIWSILGSITKR